VLPDALSLNANADSSCQGRDFTKGVTIVASTP
jgi:hypothetical protein